MTTLQSVPALGTHPANGSAAFNVKAVGRAETREQLSKATYDLLVIGGGIGLVVLLSVSAATAKGLRRPGSED